MQVMLTALQDREMLQLLSKDMFERNKRLRYETIVNQIEDRIVDKWLLTVKEQRLWNKNVKCIVKFVTHNDAGGFVLTATLDPYGESDIENYVKRVRSALTFMKIELCNNYDLDKVEFAGPDAIKVFEYQTVV